ncbi:MAG TPA: hypothetical protein DEO65_07170 [Bacillus bacterium]|uniref:Uncharacterized protein n=1 Tax=Siminovitchia fordii TaxID=254759 RepID=A0ABQ4K8K6_9BACI|nr:hypothetical protein [Siminovitchia fordii]GIN22062.1 hypothetical protein J1TS3_31960 [Siminovitchia fordii]HBZ09645.1 hypothetical protein [Bacillus sp. (in: firmicutes)]
MVTEVFTLETIFSEEETEQSFQRMQPDVAFTVSHLIYYPYLFHEYSFERKNPFSPLKGNVACTVDAISGIAALVDKAPSFIKASVDSKQIISPKVDEEKAKIIAEDFLFQTISMKIKILLTPKMRLTKYLLFHRPYLILNAEQKNKKGFTLMVDSVSGKYHPL